MSVSLLFAIWISSFFSAVIFAKYVSNLTTNSIITEWSQWNSALYSRSLFFCSATHVHTQRASLLFCFHDYHSSWKRLVPPKKCSLSRMGRSARLAGPYIKAANNSLLLVPAAAAADVHSNNNNPLCFFLNYHFERMIIFLLDVIRMFLFISGTRWAARSRPSTMSWRDASASCTCSSIRTGRREPTRPAPRRGSANKTPKTEVPSLSSKYNNNNNMLLLHIFFLLLSSFF